MKKRAKKILGLCLGTCLIVTAFTGCSSNKGNTESSQKTIEVTKFDMPDGAEESDIFVEPIDGISDDFIRGMDASAVLSIENSGAKYYNFDGEEQDV